MKTIGKLLSFSLISILALSFSSCGGGGEEEGSSDKAPSTMDALSLDLFNDGNIVLNFTRIDGDANNGQETGFIPALALEQTNYTFAQTGIAENPGGEAYTFDAASNISNLSYTYTKVGENTSTLVITGDGVNDDDADVDIFVSNDGLSPWILTLGMIFGGSGNDITNISYSFELVNGAEANGSDGSALVVREDYDETQVSLTLQDGTPLTSGYTLSIASGVERIAPVNIYPLDLSDAGRLIMTFDSAPAFGSDTLDRYELLGATDTDIVVDSDAIDQGAYLLTLYGLTTTSIQQVNFAWIVDVDSATDTTLVLTDVPDGLGTTRTERYEFIFNSTEEGTFTQVQPASGLTGTFEFPEADQPDL